jgi:phosphonate transport system substrate-binding protein
MLKRLLSTAVVAATVAAASVPTVARAAEPSVINFGIIATESSNQLKEQWLPFLRDMAKALNVEVKPFFASDYAGVIQAMRFKKVDLAWYGNKSGMEAVDHAGAEIFAQQVDLYGRPGYWSLLITNKDSGITSLQQVLDNPGKYTFGNGDPNSTSGFLVPSFYLWSQNNIDIKKHFKRVVNASHEVNALAVANGRVDIATNNTENLFNPDQPDLKVGRFFKSHPKDAEKIRVLWRSPLIPSDPMAYRKDLDPEMKAKIKAFFLSYGRIGPNAEKERKVLASISAGLAPFRESSNDQLIPIRELALAKEKNKLMSDERMDSSEKSQKLAQIDKKLEMLKQRSEILSMTN